MSGEGSIERPATGVREWTRLAGGVSADVFLLPPDRVLKLLLPGIGAEIAAREFTAANVAFAAGLPVPRPIALTEVSKRHGIVFTRLSEARLARRLRRMPGPVMATLFAMARFQARLHRIVPAADALPAAHRLLERRCAESLASAAARTAALAQLARLPERCQLLHGDLHLGNVITAQRRLMVVDWAQAMTGDPAADVARTELLMRFGRYGPGLQRHPWLRIARHAAAEWYLLCYRAITGMPPAAIDAWRLPTAVAWLRADSAAHAPSLIAYVERRLTSTQLR